MIQKMKNYKSDTMKKPTEFCKCDHDEVIVLKTRFEELQKRVEENLLNRVHQREAAEFLATETEKKVAVLHAESSALQTRFISEHAALSSRITNELAALATRIALLESDSGQNMWLVGGIAGAAVAVVLILAEHLLGGG